MPATNRRSRPSLLYTGPRIALGLSFMNAPLTVAFGPLGRGQCCSAWFTRRQVLKLDRGRHRGVAGLADIGIGGGFGVVKCGAEPVRWES